MALSWAENSKKYKWNCNEKGKFENHNVSNEEEEIPLHTSAPMISIFSVYKKNKTKKLDVKGDKLILQMIEPYVPNIFELYNDVERIICKRQFYKILQWFT